MDIFLKKNPWKMHGTWFFLLRKGDWFNMINTFSPFVCTIFTIYIHVHTCKKNWHLGNLHTYTLILWLEYIPTYTEIFKNCVYTLYPSYLIGISFICFFEMVVYYLFWIICIFLKYFQNLLLNCLNYKLYDTNTKFFRNWSIKVFFSKLLDFV